MRRRSIPRRVNWAVLLVTATATVAALVIVLVAVPLPDSVTEYGSFRLSYPNGFENVTWRNAGLVQFVWGPPSHLPAIQGSIGVICESNGTSMYSQSGFTGRGEFDVGTDLVYQFSSSGGSGGGFSIEWSETYASASSILGGTLLPH
jgi:hypothetical protein